MFFYCSIHISSRYIPTFYSSLPVAGLIALRILGASDEGYEGEAETQLGEGDASHEGDVQGHEGDGQGHEDDEPGAEEDQGGAAEG